MRIYEKIPSEGHRNIVGFRCNGCGITENGESIPKEWITNKVNSTHYCPGCTVYCASCKQGFSVSYVEYWFKNNLCDNCQGEEYV